MKNQAPAHRGSGILSGPTIKNAVETGHIRIDPFDPERLNPASYDLTLGKHVVKYSFGHMLPGMDILDAAKGNPYHRYEIPEEGIIIYPGHGYLMHTQERVATDCFVPVIDGKSSIGRLFVWVHVTAGYGDAGFDGQYTLEVTSVYPTRLYAGMRICQIRFHTIEGKLDNYKDKGNYVGEFAEGPVPSRSWKMFKNEK